MRAVRHHRPGAGLRAGARAETVRRLRETVPESYVVGDAGDRPGALWGAVTAAYDAAMAI
jgi:hypothetical protein